MNNEMRGSVVQYMSLPLGNENADRLTLASTLHPHLKRAFNKLYPHFENVVITDQNVLSLEKHRMRFLQYLPYEIQGLVQDKWKFMLPDLQKENRAGYGMDLWKVWIEEYNSWKHKQGQHQQKKVRFSKFFCFIYLFVLILFYKFQYTFLEALVFQYLYPRLDAHVSNNINHLLKSPFCVHPKTGNICVPFDPNKYEQFILADVPTLTTVINELGKVSSNTNQDANGEKRALILPSFEPSLEIFRKHIGRCIATE